MFSDKNEGHGVGEEASVDIFCLLSSPFSLVCSALEGLWCLLAGTWPPGENLASGNLTTVLYANHPKEEDVQMNRPTEISSGHKKQYYSNTKVKCHRRQNSGTNQELGFLGCILEGNRPQSIMEEHGHEVRVLPTSLTLLLFCFWHQAGNLIRLSFLFHFFIIWKWEKGIKDHSCKELDPIKRKWVCTS